MEFITQKHMIYLNDFEKIIRFIRLADTLDCRLKLASGGYEVDAKSLLGIFTLDLSGAIELSISNEKQSFENYRKTLESFMI